MNAVQHLDALASLAPGVKPQQRAEYAARVAAATDAAFTEALAFTDAAQREAELLHILLAAFNAAAPLQARRPSGLPARIQRARAEAYFERLDQEMLR